MIPLGVLAGSRHIPAGGGGPEWFGAVETPPPGASALFIRAHTGSYPYPSWVTIGGSPAELLLSGSTITGPVSRLVSMWWCQSPGPGGEVASDVGSQIDAIWEQVLYVAGLVPGEIQHDYIDKSVTTAIPHNPMLAPGGVAVSLLHHRSTVLPVPDHGYFDSGSKAAPDNVAMVNGVWTAGTDLPTNWTTARYHAQMTVALNPIGT